MASSALFHRSTALAATLVLLAGSGARAQPAGAPSPAMPSIVNVAWTQPGPSPMSYTASLRHEGARWSLIGCGVAGTNLPSGCRATSDIVLSPAQVSALEAAWRDTRGRIRCEPEALTPGARPYRVDAGSESITGLLPADAAAMGPSVAGPCRAWTRFVWTVARAFLSGPTP